MLTERRAGINTINRERGDGGQMHVDSRVVRAIRSARHVVGTVLAAQGYLGVSWPDVVLGVAYFDLADDADHKQDYGPSCA